MILSNIFEWLSGLTTGAPSDPLEIFKTFEVIVKIYF